MPISKPSILFVNRVYPPGRGATGRVLHDLAHAFARDGWEVTVLCAGAQRGVTYDGPVKVVRVYGPLRRQTFLRYLIIWLRLFFKALRLPRARLLVTMSDPPMLILAGQMAARVKNCRHMHWCQDLYPDLLPALGYELPGFVYTLLERLSRRAMKSADKVVTVGRCMARRLTHTGVPPRTIAVVPNWPDQEILTGESGDRKRLITTSNPEEAGPLFAGENMKFRILYAGNIGRAHPMQTVLDAAALLDGPHPEIEFVFAGEGQGFERLAQERSRRGLQNVRFLPRQPPERLRELMESGDVHMISMKNEVAGMLVPCKVYAAFAAARPCILVGPKDTEVARVIRDFKAGEIVPQGEAAALAEVIRAYRMDGERWFSAHQGAAEAGKVFLPRESWQAWIDRARDVVRGTGTAKSPGDGL